jgi:hypothetical protein
MCATIAQQRSCALPFDNNNNLLNFTTQKVEHKKHTTPTGHATNRRRNLGLRAGWTIYGNPEIPELENPKF